MTTEDKKLYRDYGLIRYVVCNGRCENLTPEQVKKQINAKHYDHLKKIHKLTKERVNEVINHFVKATVTK